jgi:hypothetical protein
MIFLLNPYTHVLRFHLSMLQFSGASRCYTNLTLNPNTTPRSRMLWCPSSTLQIGVLTLSLGIRTLRIGALCSSDLSIVSSRNLNAVTQTVEHLSNARSVKELDTKLFCRVVHIFTKTLDKGISNGVT